MDEDAEPERDSEPLASGEPKTDATADDERSNADERRSRSASKSPAPEGDPESDEGRGSETGSQPERARAASADPERRSRSDDGPSTPGDDRPSADAGPSGSTDGNEEPDSTAASVSDATGPSEAEGERDPMPGVPDPEPDAARRDVPEDVQKYARFQKMDGAQYERVNEFLRERTYVTAREWAIARLCADFRTETGVEMTKIGENLPELVPFMTDTYTPQAVNQARASFEEKVRKAGATFLYGAMCDFFTAEDLDDVMYEATEVAKFLLEVEGVDLTVEEELDAEERISAVMREVRAASKELREEDVGSGE